MAAAGKIPVYLSIGESGKHQIGALDVLVSTEAPATAAEGLVHVEFNNVRVADMLEAVAAEIREKGNHAVHRG